MNLRHASLITTLLSYFVLFSVQIQARGVNEHIVRTGWEEISFVSRLDLGYVTISAYGPAAEHAMATALEQLDAEDVKSIKGLKRRGFSIVLNKEGMLSNQHKISALVERSEIRYVAPLFSSNEQTVAIIPEIVVRLIKGTKYERIQKLCDDIGLVIERKLEYTEDEYLISTDVTDANGVFDIVEELNTYAFIKWAVPNVAFRPQLLGQVIPNDSYFPDQWHLRNTGQSGGTPGADINVTAAWEVTTGDPNIVVAVLDQGVDTNHPDLINNIVPGYDFYDDDNSPEPNGDDAHGTACAGLIAADGNNTIGVTGVAWNCKIMPIRIGGGADFVTDVDIATAIRWAATSGADVMSNSWGGNFAMPVIHSALFDVTEPNGIGRDGKGCVVLFAAGNAGLSTVSYPALYAETIAVGATDSNDELWSYSNYGTGLDIVTPSGATNYQGDIWTTDIGGTLGINNRDPNILDYTDKMGGTSGACPIAAGVTALVLSVDPNLTSLDVRCVLQASAVDLGEPGRDSYYGHGRVDANAALSLVLNQQPVQFIYIDDNAPNDPGPGDSNVSDPNEDGSIQHPFDCIQEAIDITEYSDEVVILEGIYTGQGNRDIDFGARAITIRSIDPNDPNVVASTIIDSNGDETEPHRAFHFQSGEGRCSVLAGLTMINGYGYQGNGGGILCDHSSPTITNCIFSGNSQSGMHNSYSCPRLIDCSFAENSALGTGTYSGGGGLYNYSSSPVLINCTFSENYTTAIATYNGGGAIYNKSSSPILIDCVFIENTSAHHGGAIYNYESSKPYLTCCTFTENSAGGDGGAIDNYYSSPVLIDCIFSGNSTENQGGGMQNFGIDSCPVLVNCIFNGNKAGQGGGINNAFDATPGATDCLFSGNLAGEGGGVYGGDDGSPFRNCVFTGNNAASSGGGMYNNHDPILHNCIFVGNFADYGGGGLSNYWGSPELNNCTIANNTSGSEGGGIWINNSNPIITNCVLWNNADSGCLDESAQIHVYAYSSELLDINFCCVQSWTGTLGGLGNLGIDPGFADSETGTWTSCGLYDSNEYQIILTNDNANWQENELSNKFVNPDVNQPLHFVIVSNTPNTVTIWADWQCINDVNSWVVNGANYEIYDYHLKSEAGRWEPGKEDWIYDLQTSRCIDAGNPGSPLNDEQNEPNNIRINMGAYGGTSEASKTPEGWGLLADLTNDGAADFQDYAAQAQDWQLTGDRLPGDLNRDRVVDITDIALFTEDWLEQTSWIQL